MEVAPPPTMLQELPVAVIGSGPVGLAAAAHLMERGLQPLILEAGTEPAAAVREWAHIQLFSPWRYNIDAAARRLLDAAGWQAPDLDAVPTAAELVSGYLTPLAGLAPVALSLRLGTRVTAVARLGLDRTQSAGREQRPFLIRTADRHGVTSEHLAAAVIDTSGTWGSPNPIGASGLPCPGKAEARTMGLVSGPLPDVLGADRDRFAGRRVLVTGSGHSAANSLLALAELAETAGGRISWAVRGDNVRRLFGGGDQDGLPDRGALGQRLKALVEAGRIDLRTGFTVTGLKGADTLLVTGGTADGEEQMEVDVLVPATGFRPDHSWLREIRLDLDPVVEAPRQLGPMIDPEFHSCGTVPPHGARTLAHLEQDFYIAGAKSYGRAPTFLMATGYEQVRSIAAELAGDTAAADEVHLVLPETGVCSTDPAPAVSAESGGCCSADTGSVDVEVQAPASNGRDAGCCAGPESAPTEAATGAPTPAFLGIPTGLMHGRSGDQPERTRILVVEDHPVVRLGLRTVLAEQPDLQVVGEASDEQETLAAVGQLRPDLVILPLRLGSELRGIELCRELKSRGDAPRVLIYTSYNSPADASSSYFSGADSFLHKGEVASRLLDAVRGTMAGRRVWIVGSEAGGQPEQFRQQVDESPLTSREREILGFMLQRLTNAEIAHELFIEVPTVKTHVSSILQKLGLRSRRDLF